MGIIRGQNLGDKEVEFKPLSERFMGKSERVKRITSNIQKIFETANEESKQIPTRQMRIKDGLVEIRGGLLHHRCTSKIDGLDGIAQMGVLASEWFGFLESEGEARLCAFLSRWNTEEQEKIFKTKGPNSNAAKLGDISGKSVILFFDETHPVMQKLVHIDYFEYEKIKRTNPQKMQEYTQEQTEILDFIEANSNESGKSFHLDETDSRCNWLAIPGGIPSRLINGICVSCMKYKDEYIRKLHSLFPQATIFNGSKQVLYNPELSQFIQIEELQSHTTSDTSELKKTEKIEDEELQL